MIIKKHIEIAMNIQDCIALYTDVDANLKNMLVDRYTGRCLRQCYILEILGVIKFSDCVINQEGPPDFGVINVIFEALVIVYTPGEIINGCTVVSRETTGTIICSHANTNIVLSHNVLLDSIQPGQKISVHAHSIRYTIGDSKISVSAVPVAPTKQVVLYRYVPTTTTTTFSTNNAITNIDTAVGNTLPDDFHDYIAGTILGINEIKEKSADLIGTKNYEFFNLILYAYKEKQKVAAGIHTDILALIESPPTTECYIGYDPRTYPTSGMVYVHATADAIGREDVRIINDVPLVQILPALLDGYYNAIRTVYEMVNIYNTQELINSHKNLWMIYAAIKNK